MRSCAYFFLRGFFSTVVHPGSHQIPTDLSDALSHASGSGGRVSSCFSTASAQDSLFIFVSNTRAAKFISYCVVRCNEWAVGTPTPTRRALAMVKNSNCEKNST